MKPNTVKDFGILLRYDLQLILNNKIILKIKMEE